MAGSRASYGRAGSALLRDPAARAVVALGVTQIVSWGTTLYVLGVLGKPIAADTGWNQSTVFAGLTVGLLVASAVSTTVGRLIDRRGGRIIMAAGSVLVSVLLLALSRVSTPVEYLAVWIGLGLAMRMTLYDAAFAALVQVTPSRGRRAISYLTLFGGFASSIFWPIAHWLDGAYGWRTTLAIFALINLVLCLPLHWIGLARRETAPAFDTAGASIDAAPKPSDTTLVGAPRRAAMVLFGLVVSLCGFVFGALAVHLVPLIEASGVGIGTAVTLAALKGVAQVAGRVCDLVFGRNLHALTLGRISIAFMPLSFAVLVLGGASFAAALAFTLLFGVSNGLITIVRGAVPLALFGSKGYGEVLGILATPYLLLNALAPAIFALLAESSGYRAGVWLLLTLAVLAALAMEVMAFWYRRRVRGAG